MWMWEEQQLVFLLMVRLFTNLDLMQKQGGNMLLSETFTNRKPKVRFSSIATAVLLSLPPEEKDFTDASRQNIVHM